MNTCENCNSVCLGGKQKNLQGNMQKCWFDVSNVFSDASNLHRLFFMTCKKLLIAAAYEFTEDSEVIMGRKSRRSSCCCRRHSLTVCLVFVFFCVCNFLVPEDELVKMNIFFITAGRYSPYTFSHYTFFFLSAVFLCLKKHFQFKAKIKLNTMLKDRRENNMDFWVFLFCNLLQFTD